MANWAKISGGKVADVKQDPKHPGPGWHQVPDEVEKGHDVKQDAKGGFSFTRAQETPSHLLPGYMPSNADLATQIAAISQDIAQIKKTLNMRSKKK